MDVAAYLAGDGDFDSGNEVLDKLKADAIRATKPAERYGSVADYDPVLRAHCRL